LKFNLDKVTIEKEKGAEMLKKVQM